MFINFYEQQTYNGLKAWKNGSELQFSNPDSTKTLYEFAQQRLPNDGSFFLQYGIFMEDKNTKTALSLFEKAIQLTNLPILYTKTAQLNEQLGNFKKAEKDLLKFHYFCPHLFKPQEELLNFYNRRNYVQKVKWIAKKIMKAPIKIPSQEVIRIKQKAKFLYNKP